MHVLFIAFGNLRLIRNEARSLWSKHLNCIKFSPLMEMLHDNWNRSNYIQSKFYFFDLHNNWRLTKSDGNSISFEFALVQPDWINLKYFYPWIIFISNDCINSSSACLFRSGIAFIRKLWIKIHRKLIWIIRFIVIARVQRKCAGKMCIKTQAEITTNLVQYFHFEDCKSKLIMKFTGASILFFVFAFIAVSYLPF